LAFAREILQWIFLTKIIEKTRPSGKTFDFQFRISLIDTIIFDLWDLAALRRPLLHTGWLFLAFEMTKFSNKAEFLIEFRIAIFNLHCYLLVFLSLICPDFATCYPALH